MLHAVAYEENIAKKLITEGKRCMNTGKLDEAINLFLEASKMHKFRETFGSAIMANLAYAYAQKKNFTLAK